jgi:trk system potassium uptake protein TrkA
MRVVVAGGGRVGFETATLLDDRGHDVVVVEEDPDRCEVLSDAYVATVIEGDATRPAVLRQASPETADAVAALTGMSGANLAVCMQVEQMAPEVRTVARIDAAEEREYEKLVDDVIYPERAGARAAANSIVADAVRTVSDLTGRLEVMEVTVAEGAPAAGRDLTEVRLPTGSLVVSAADGDAVAGPDTVLEPGRRYVVAVDPDVADEVMNVLRG